MIPSDEDEIARILRELASLPPDRLECVVAEIIANAMSMMDTETIRELRDEITSEFDVSLPVVTNTLNLIDGHLAMREMQDE